MWHVCLHFLGIQFKEKIEKDTDHGPASLIISRHKTCNLYIIFFQELNQANEKLQQEVDDKVNKLLNIAPNGFFSWIINNKNCIGKKQF